MNKVNLAKKTAKLMVEKLSPKELENELYQLLILLSNEELDYAHTDIESGDIAGTPHPVDVLQGSDSINMQKEQLTQKEIDKKYDEFSSGDFVYGYDSNMDRWLPYTLVSYNIGDDGSMQDIELKEYFVGAPSDNVGQKTIDYNGEIRKQPESKVFLVEDYLYNNPQKFISYVEENSSLVDYILLDMSGTFEIFWNDNYMKGFSTFATPFWEEEFTIPVDVQEEGYESIGSDRVGWNTNKSFNIEDSIYPNNPNDFYEAYVDTLPEILDKSKMIVENTKNKK